MPSDAILIVEDEAIVADGLQALLEENGYEVTGVAATGMEALNAADGRRPDLVLMDVKLQGAMDGVETARLLRERLDVPVVYLTAYADEETLSRAGVTEPFGYVIKPYGQRELLAALRMALLRHGAEGRVKEALAQTQRAREALDYQKRFFETLFGTLPCGVVVVNRMNRVLAVNPFLERTLDLPRDSILSKSVGEILECRTLVAPVPGASIPDCLDRCDLHRAIHDVFDGIPVNRRKAEVSLTRKGQTRRADLLVSAASLQFEGEDLCLLILEDVTELNTLRHLLQTQRPPAGLVGQDEKMLSLFEAIREVADSSVPVLIQGQSGTGKDLVATAIHDQGPLSAKPFVAVNCGALPEGLLESELFGHVKGAFTGAIRDKKGRFELADGGTLFLDEVAELGPHVQVKLLRVLQNGTFERVGGEETIRVDVRVICATNRDLLRDVGSGRFREDLYYRLAVVPITVPPLSERRSDIPLLASHFLAECSRERGEGEASLTPESLALLLDHPWSGNVRELKNVVQYAFIKARGGTLRPEHLPPSFRAEPRRPLNGLIWKPRLDENKVLDALRQSKGNKVRAARLLGVSRSTLYRFIEERFEEKGSPS